MQPLSIVIPAWNEAPGLPAVLADIQTFTQSYGAAVEVVVVDDGSIDGTADVATRLGARVVRNPSNAGYGFSLRRGILAATHDTVVITDADGTYPIAELPHLVRKYEEGFDMVVGARQGEHYRGSLLKNPARSVFRVMSEFVAGRHIPDINSGLRVMRRASVLPYLSEICLGFSFTTSLTLAMMLDGRFVAYIPISYHARIGASKIRIVRDTLRVSQVLAKTIVRHNPIKLFLLLAAVPFMAALVLGVIGFLGTSAAFPYAFGALAVGWIVTALGLFSEIFIRDKAM